MSHYPLSAAMSRFVAATQAFSVQDPAMTAQRQAYSAMCSAFTLPAPAGLYTADATVAGVGVRRYWPRREPGADGWAWLLYLHGGGWCVGDLDSHDFICAHLADALQVTVVAVNYRLAPEHPFPAAFHDVLTVYRALGQGVMPWSLNPRQCVVAGDSAGGNLAAALCLALRDRGLSMPAGQLLIYPGLGAPAHSASRQACADAPLLGSADLAFYLDTYVPLAARNSRYALPLLCKDYHGLPPAWVAVAQWDPLRDDGVLYHRYLLASEVQSTFYPGLGLVHGCLRGRGQVPEVDALYAAMLAWLRELFTPPAPPPLHDA